MKVAYFQCQGADEVMALLKELSPRTVIFDVEPLIAYWDTGTPELDAGVTQFLRQASASPGIRVVAFATNSTRRPSTDLTAPDVRVLYRSTAMKPFRTRQFRDLPLTGVLVGDQIATDGLLAWRLGYSFVYYRPERERIPLGPRLMNLLGLLVRPFIFRSD